MNATVEIVRFYEAGWDPPEQKDREYNRFFKSDEAKYIYWELHLRHPKRSSDTQGAIHEQWFQDGKRIRREGTEHTIPASWTGSSLSSGAGGRTLRGWDVGSYGIDL